MNTPLPTKSSTSAVILDASVIAKFFLANENSEKAAHALPSEALKIAPSIAHFEMLSLLNKHVRRSSLSKQLAHEAHQLWLAALEEEWISLVPSEEYANKAFELSCELRHAFYDICYLELARERAALLITADKQLYERGKGVYEHIILVE